MALSIALIGGAAAQTIDEDGLEALAACESGHLGNLASTGNGYYGAYQFLPSTWNATIEAMMSTGAVGSDWVQYLAYINPEPEWANTPDRAPAWVQDAVASWLWNNSGSYHWPNCASATVPTFAG